MNGVIKICVSHRVRPYSFWLQTAPANGLTLDAYVDQVLSQCGAVNYPNRADTTFNRESRGIMVSTIQMHHQYLQAFFLRTDTIFQFSARLNILAECGAMNLGLSNPTPFYHAVETFRFLP